jgi:hypothetical protein
MRGQSSILHGVLKGFAAIKGLFSKSPGPSASGEELRSWMRAQPDIAEEARQGFEAIDAGRYRRVSRRGHT